MDVKFKKLTNYFNYYNLKKRIEMMNKKKPQPVYKIKWLLAPLGAIVILLAFNAQRAIATNVDFAVTNEIVEITSDTLAERVAKRVAGKISYRKDIDTSNFMITCCCDDSNRPQPLILIDGKEASSDEMSNLVPDDIHSFSVIKNDSAKIYGEKGKGGVILVKTKENHKISETKKLLYSMDWLKQTNVKYEPLFNKGLLRFSPQPRPEQTDVKYEPWVMIDEKESNEEELQKLKPEDIESFSIIKDENATAMYGDKGINGVVLVKMK
jgi:TonB-dependent SusC/RagA subfamily outer membrane receptor